VRSGNLPETTLDYTGQKKDDTGLLFYNARYYDPVIARFVSADTIVPGTSAGSGGAAATVGSGSTTPLTVDFHEAQFLSQLNGVNAQRMAQGFWFELGGEQKQKAEAPHGPVNPQALNRYSYVLNNPLRYTDPTGHTVYLNHSDAIAFVNTLRSVISKLDAGDTLVQPFGDPYRVRPRAADPSRST
jgi:RHS repeat-associated protein